MKIALYIIAVVIFFGCANKELTLKEYDSTRFVEDKVGVEDDYEVVLALFINNCRSHKTQKLYGKLCEDAKNTNDAKAFFRKNFSWYRLEDPKKGNIGLLTGYYEASLHGSLLKSGRYIHPVYATPKDLVSVDLSSIYPELGRYRLRGRLEGNKLVPYYKRGEKTSLLADVICYVDDKVDLFFLEIQGSGRVELTNGDVMYIGYDDQNGHRYSSIGRYLIKKGYIKKEEMSMSAIREFFKNHPEKVDEVLNQNASMVFFKRRDTPATGAMGLELTPMQSIAVDRSRVPLGGMYIYKTDHKDLGGIVFAQDVGGAIKGSVRADLFTGYGAKAAKVAGSLKSPLQLWICLPKREKNE